MSSYRHVLTPQYTCCFYSFPFMKLALGLTELVIFFFCSIVLCPNKASCLAYFFSLTPSQEFQKADWCNYIAHPSGKRGLLCQAWSSEAIFQADGWKPQILTIIAKLVIGTQRRVLLASHGVLNYTWLQHCWNISHQPKALSFAVLFTSMTRSGFSCFDLWINSLNIDFKICLQSISWTQVFFFVKSVSEIPFTLKHKHVCFQVVYKYFDLRMLRELTVCKLKNVCTCSPH